jgi:hypothetical protein
MYAMKSRFLLILLAALYAGVGAYAATVTVTVDGSASTYTLNGVSVDANGNTNVSATSISDGGTTPPPVTTYTLTYTAGTGGTISGSNFQTVSADGSGTAVTAVANTGYAFANWSDDVTTASRTDSNVQANLSVTANFSAVVSGNCPTPGSNVQIVETGVQGATFPQTTYSNLTPSSLQAFKFVYTGQSIGVASSTATSTTPTARMVVVSECPGQIQNTGMDSACTRYSVDKSSVRTAAGYPLADPRTYCRLEIGKTYYANMFAQTYTTVGSTSYTCSTTLCSHSVNIQ